MEMKMKNVAGDVILNLISAAIPIATLQLIALPMMAQQLGEDPYGLALTLISLFSIIATPLGNALNNTRLLQEAKYLEAEEKGDFNLLLLGSIIINIILVAVGSVYYLRGGHWLDVLLVVLIACLNLAREYYIVAFRLLLNYRAILMNNIWLCIGYLSGLGIFLMWWPRWQCIYVCGGFASLVYVMIRVKLQKEPLVKTRLMKKTAKIDLTLVAASFLKSIPSYADKLLIYPMLGSAAVSVYYSASIFSKLVIMALTPIGSVLLSYLAKMKSFPTRKLVLLSLCTTLLGIIGVLFCMLIGRPVLELLYPQWADRSMELMPVVTFSAVLIAVSSVVNPFVMRFCDITWQFVLSISDAVFYLLCAYIFYRFFGLMGFCYGIVFSSAEQVILKCVVYWRKQDDMQ